MRPKRRARPHTVLLIVASAMFLEQLDGTVLATALPIMAGKFNADPLHMNIALTSYLLTLAMFIPEELPGHRDRPALAKVER